MVLNCKPCFKANKWFLIVKPYYKEQASKKMVLNYQTIFKANNGFELLNHVSSKQASKWFLSCKTIFQEQASKRIFSKTCLTKIPSSKQAYRSKVFRTCMVVLGYHTCILDLPGRQT